MIKLSLLIFLGILTLSSSTFFEDSFDKGKLSDTELVKEAILDYVEGVYNADTSRIYRSVHPALVKRGAWYENDNYVPIQEMSFKQLVNLTKQWNSNGNRADAQSVRDIVIYDVQDKTAVAKLTAVWGTDYFHLAKLDGTWYIMNVLWQSPPRD